MKLPLDIPCLVRNGEPLRLDIVVRPHAALMVGFWAVWCTPCQEFLASFAEMAASKRFSNLAFAAVNVDVATAEEAEARMKEFTALSSFHEESDGLLTRLLSVKFVPSTAVIAADGEVLYFGALVSSKLRMVLSGFQNYQTVDAPPSEWGGRDRRCS